MQSYVFRNELAVFQPLKCLPFITLQLPFDPKMTGKYVLEKRLKTIVEKIKNELYENYPLGLAKEVYEKLQTLISKLDYNTHKKSIAILVSSREQKVYYLDVNVIEKFSVANSFQFRQLVYQIKDEKEYLLLVLSDYYAAIYRGKELAITKILLNVPKYAKDEQYNREDSKEAALSLERKALIEKFIRFADNNLSFILYAFQLPVFVLGSGQNLSCFRQITQNEFSITGFIQGEFNHASEDEIESAIQPFITHWNKVKDNYLIQQLEKALKAEKLVGGIQDVWNLTKINNIKLLVVEEDFKYHAYLEKGIIVSTEDATNSSLIKDAVEDIIEKVMASGGNVAFVAKGALKNFMQIAAIKNY